MALRIIQVTLPAQRKKTLLQIAERHKAIDVWWGAKNEDGMRTMSLLVDRAHQQDTLDSIQTHLDDVDNWRAVLLPVEASLPRNSEPNETTPKKKFQWRKSLTREELYTEVKSGADGDPIFYMMVLLSTIVAAIGLINDNVAIVIAAMVIAPLLGPNLALAFGTALGDSVLIKKSLMTCALGLLAAIIPCIVLGVFLPPDITSHELHSRTEINFSAIILALASGAAAVLSLTTGVSSALVGVMVSVALLPPAVAFGIFIGMGATTSAGESGLLLLTNIVCVGISSQAVLLMMGIRPRTFLDKRAANQSSLLQVGICCALLLIISIIILYIGE
ncbi:MAG: TIGR00341 family protein [Alphaproteobacteria bacterium]|nr:MAG: TIGR00341 family protein [Alphaproteobacteria bacterium]